MWLRLFVEQFLDSILNCFRNEWDIRAPIREAIPVKITRVQTPAKDVVEFALVRLGGAQRQPVILALAASRLQSVRARRKPFEELGSHGSFRRIGR